MNIELLFPPFHCELFGMDITIDKIEHVKDERNYSLEFH